MLEAYGVTEANWRDATKRQPALRDLREPGVRRPGGGRARRDPDVSRWNGQSLSSGQLAKVYGFTDLDGSQPDAWRYVSRSRTPASPPTSPATADTRGTECEDARVPDDPTAFLLDDEAFAGDPFPAYARLRAEAPVARNTQVGFWVFSKHADVLAASTDPTTFCSRGGSCSSRSEPSTRRRRR